MWKERRKGRGLYGARKVWLQLRREGVEVARCTVERLMREMGIAGVSAQRKKPRTTVPDTGAGGPGTCWNGTSPRQRRTAAGSRISRMCRSACGFVYTAFVTDLFSRKIVGWQVADHLRAGLALDALEMAIFARRDGIGDELVHIPTAAFNIPLSAIPSGWRISARSARSAAKAIPTITLQRRRSTHCTRRNSSTTRARGKTPGR